MLVVISYPTTIANEANITNALFNEGLEILHLRKPEVHVDNLRELIEKISPQFHHQIALHQHHEIAGDFGMNRLHFTEDKRKEMSEEILAASKTNNILSTSIHHTEVYNTLSCSFEYTFFGPVFNSISKQGCISTLNDDFIFPVKKNHPKVIAIAGIDVTNIKKVAAMEFDGIAALGTIWQRPEESIQQFKALQKAWKQTDR